MEIPSWIWRDDENRRKAHLQRVCVDTEERDRRAFLRATSPRGPSRPQKREDGGLMAVSGSERARIEAVVRQHEWLIGLLAKSHGRYRRGIPRPDLLHAGRIGLWNAARGFDEARGVKFPSYAGVFVL